MRLTKQKTSNVVGLEIEADSLAATEVRLSGGPQVVRSAIRPLEPGQFGEGEVIDAEAVAAGLKALFSEEKLSKRVRVGIASQKVFVRTLRMPAIEDPKEMNAAVRFQAQEQMPMPIDEAVLEHQVVGGVAAEEGGAPQIDVILVAARRDTIKSLLAPVRQAGLEPVGVDLSAFAMIRALAGEGGEPEAATDPASGPPEGAVLYCGVGDVANLAIARKRSCLFTRVSPAGLEPISVRLRSTRGLTPEHAAQWMTHVGLDEPIETVPGDPEAVSETRKALEDGLADLVDETRLSLDYYGAQEASVPVERVVLCGPGGAIPGLGERLEADLGLPVNAATPSGLEALGPSVAARLTLPYGLALED